MAKLICCDLAVQIVLIYLAASTVNGFSFFPSVFNVPAKLPASIAGRFLSIPSAILPKALRNINLPGLPSPTKFLSWIFNIPSEQVTELVDTFFFSEKAIATNDIAILLYGPDGYFEINHLDNVDIPLEPYQEIKIIIHGFQSYGTANWTERMAKTYHRIGIRNTIGIDWQGVANEKYFTAASATKILGYRVAEWLFYKLLRGNPMELGRVHLIGHSLGAHISGFIGKRIYELTDGLYLIGRISGLDAAAPLFEFPVRLKDDFRLHVRDANIVENYHTNSGFFGFVRQIGHRDIYVSYGGPVQPGCIKGINVLETPTYADDSVQLSSTDFLSILLNTTKEKVKEYADSFTFSDQDISDDEVGILLFKEGGDFDLYRLSSDNIPLEPNQDIKIIIHGYTSSGYTNWTQMMAMAYHNIGIRNTIAIDWGVIANKIYYVAASSTKTLGNLIGEWLFYRLLHSNPRDLRYVHLIGHSLGSHVSGFAGKKILEITDGQNQIGRISGLDPAAPLFEYPLKLQTSLRLDKSDAEIVDAYHTNSGFFGFLGKVGHGDFYISYGGPIQPGCNKLLNIIESLTCSHSISHKIFTKTIESRNYLATECSNKLQYFKNKCKNNRRVIMGEHTSFAVRGKFYINIDEDGNPKAR